LGSITVEWTPEPRELADLELLLSGAFQPLTGFLGHDDVHAVHERGTLADGTPWPAPVTLHLPEDAGGEVTLLDPEGLQLYTIRVN
jgi:sulfate adenylyltransferase